MNAHITWAGPAEFCVPPTEPDLRGLPARQQPDWGDRWLVDEVRRDLATLPGLVDPDEVRDLRGLLADVAAGHRRVVQAGDCAEDPGACTADAIGRKVGLLDALAGVLGMATGRPVLRAGRIAGQYAKPRTEAVEDVGGQRLPVFRGPLVNSPEPDPAGRRHDPLRLLTCYDAARETLVHLRTHAATSGTVWTSHEALVLDYELPLLRRDDDGHWVLTSAHWPWIGERTRQPDGAHVRLLAVVRNPVACKVGPGMTPGDLLELCGILDPDREPGRLTLITRLGAARTVERLPALVAAVRAAGHPVVWLCDPMHGNTVRAPDGRKTRLVSAVLTEVRDFQAVLAAAGAVPAGLHLEATPDPVAECVSDESGLGRPAGPYTTLCDPRLNSRQALDVVASWHR
jgi:3-deoxy-7-phosphoheptulonate synthase